MKEKLTCQLSEKEYREFVHWYHGTYIKMRRAKPGKTVFSCLKEPVELTAKEDMVYGKSGACEVYLLYGAVEKLYELETLFVFYDMKRFWAVPKRNLGSKEEAAEWRTAFESRIRELGKMRISFQEAAEACADSKFTPRRYTRQIDEVKAEYGLLRISRREMERLRKLGTFPYRMIGEQMLAAGKRGIIEISERAAVLHPYETITGAFYTEQTLYLAEKEGDGILVPLAALGGLEGAEALMNVCDTRCRFNNPAFRLRKKSIPLSVRWERPGMAVAAALCIAAAGIAFLGTVYWKGENRSTAALSSEVPGNDRAETGEPADGKHGGGEAGGSAFQDLTAVIPDDTVFDVVTEEGTFASSTLYYQLILPKGEWKIWQDRNNAYDSLVSDWGSISVTGGPTGSFEGYGLTQMLPKTKAEYQARANADSGSFGAETEVIDYSLEEMGDCLIVRRELRNKGKEGSRSVIGLEVYGPERCYSLSITPDTEDAVSMQTARAVRDSFRIADMTTGICKEMEAEVFHGYYGDNTYMTSCLVLMDRAMSDEEIAEGLREMKKLRSAEYPASPYSASGDALAARTPDSKWLGIDCASVQQNCTKETAKEVARIFQAEVIIYDEFDGDLLMVACSDADRKHAYERATANAKWILESEFQCYGKEQDFPEMLLKYMDISKEEAEAVWKSGDYIFQMDKWAELTGHMTKMPVPQEFIGLYDIDALDERFRVIRE